MLNQDRAPNHLLIAEDDVQIRDLIAEWISFNHDYRLSLAPDGERALEIFERDPADVILSDLRMPNMGGVELLRRIKEISPRTQFIMMSGFEDYTDTVEALRKGAVDFFQKPFKMGELMASLERAFKQIWSRRRESAVQTYLVEETRKFSIPNDIDGVTHLSSELTRSLVADGSMDEMTVEGVRGALHEMIVNAIEHGNLEITYDQKSKLMESPEGWRREIERRAKDPHFRERRVWIECRNTPDAVAFTIRDEGGGFDYANLPDPTELTHVPHGRGILITSVHMDELKYSDAGSEVTIVKYKRPELKVEAA